MKAEELIIAGRPFRSRLFTGTGKFSSVEMMEKAILSTESELVTVALKRVESKLSSDKLLKSLTYPHIHLLPNTSGARTAKEAILAAELSREAFETNWLKLEIHPDPKYLLPDSEETIEAAKELSKRGFIILPYINADPVACKKLEEAGCAAVMPLGSPIGSNNGLQTKAMLEIIISQSSVPVIVDAGIGVPSHASEAMEMGASAVLVNTAIAVASDPVKMAHAFKLAVEAGRLAYESGPGSKNVFAEASSPFTAFLDEVEN